VSTGAAGTVTAAAPEISLATLSVGAVWALKNQKISNLVIKDSAATPVTVAAADYTADLNFGTVVVNNLGTGAGAYVLPLKANYTYAASSAVAFFTQAASEVALRFEGINTADSNKKVLVEIYRVALDPTKELGLISDELGKFTLEGNALVDTTKPDNDVVFGKFGRMIYVD
jgi:hypothetical protein